jgi:hypothetical protein
MDFLVTWNCVHIANAAIAKGNHLPADSPIPRYLNQPEVIFEPIWALPDRARHALGDTENSLRPLATG